MTIFLPQTHKETHRQKQFVVQLAQRTTYHPAWLNGLLRSNDSILSAKSADC
jgi:hypothetical protein